MRRVKRRTRKRARADRQVRVGSAFSLLQMQREIAEMLDRVAELQHDVNEWRRATTTYASLVPDLVARICRLEQRLKLRRGHR